MLENQLINFHKASNKDKSDPRYGLEVAQSIYQSISYGFNGYFSRRNKKIRASRDIAAGIQNMNKFLDLLKIDGKESFLNLDMTPPKIAPKFIDIIVQRFMERLESVSVSAIDPQSKRKAERAKLEAEFRMTNKDLINQLTVDSGVPMENPDDYTPDDKDDLEYYFGYEYQLPEEIKFEKAIQYVLTDNDWDPELKRKIIRDLIEAGLGVTKTYVDVNGTIRTRRVIPENSIHSWSTEDDFRGLGYCGELIKMKVTEYRALFNNDYVRQYGPLEAEKMIFEDVMKAAMNCPGYTRLDWNFNWANSYYRPYDEYEVEVLDFEFKTVDNDIFTAKKNKYGNLIAVDRKDKVPQNIGENKEVHVRQVYNIYCGYYVPMLTKIFCWERAKNMIRPQSNLSDVYFSFSFYMPDNRDMYNITLPERMRTSIDQMTFAHLKLQQLIARMRPAGLAVDISGMQDLDIGLGGTTSPMKLLQIANQTGDVFYRSNPESGEGKQFVPITELPNAGAVNQIQATIQHYNFYLDILRQTIGSNEYTEGQSVNPKLGLGVMDNQIAASNRATEFIYEGYLSICKQTCRNVGILAWDNIVFGGAAYREFMGEEKLDETRFDVNIEMMPNEAERALIAQQIQAALTAGTIDFMDAFKINNIRNIKLKQLYLARAQKKKQQQLQQAALENTKANTESQIQSAQATSQAKQQELQVEMQGKAALQQMTDKGASAKSMQDFVQELQLESFKLGRPLPDNLQVIVDQYYNAKAEEEQSEAEMNDMAMQQMAQEQQTPEEQSAGQVA